MIQKIFVYGTLRTGGYFSRVLPTAKSIVLQTLTGIRMYTLGAFPCVIITGEDTDYVLGELRDYTNLLEDEWTALIKELDRIENVSSGLYKRETINTKLGEAVIYVANREAWFDREMKVHSEHNRMFRMIHDWADEDLHIKRNIDGTKIIKAGK